MKYFFNSNFQIQDQDGNIIADLWRNPRSGEDGPRIARFLSGDFDGMVHPKFNPPLVEQSNIADDVLEACAVATVQGEISKSGDVIHYPIKMTQSEKMKEYWRKKKGL